MAADEVVPEADEMLAVVVTAPDVAATVAVDVGKAVVLFAEAQRLL